MVFSEGACDRFNKIDAVLENAAISITVLMTAANIIILSLYCIEIIIVPLKNRIVETNVFGWKKILLLKELLKQWKIESSKVKINTVTVKE